MLAPGSGAEVLARRGVLEIFELASIPTCEVDCACAPCCGLFVVASVANAASDCCESQRKKKKKATACANKRSHPL